jgi:hypothetical protein
MTSSASDHDEELKLETVPLELLPLHQGLEEDGSSWRAALPRADNLLRRVAVSPLRDGQRDSHIVALDAPPISLNVPTLPVASVLPPPTPRQRRRPRREPR